MPKIFMPIKNMADQYRDSTALVGQRWAIGSPSFAMNVPFKSNAFVDA